MYELDAHTEGLRKLDLLSSVVAGRCPLLDKVSNGVVAALDFVVLALYQPFILCKRVFRV